MLQVSQGRRDPVAQRARLPQTGVYPPYAAKALFKMNSFLARLLKLSRNRIEKNHADCHH
jgi:hypothetical protein